MLAIKQIAPPCQFNPQGIGQPVIGVRIVIVPDVVAPLFTPERNRVGTEILWRLLKSRMEQAGVRVTEVYRGFPLNQSFYMFSVSELTPALESIKEDLEKLGLLEWAHIVWLDPREDVWRIWYSKAAWFEPPSDEELAAEGQLFDSILSAAKKSKQSEDEPSGQ